MGGRLWFLCRPFADSYCALAAENRPYRGTAHEQHEGTASAISNGRSLRPHRLCPHLVFDGPELLRCLTLFNAIELALLGLINVVWLISIHATGIMATMLLVGLVFGWAASLIVLPFVVLVCWVRLYLKRHNPLQILAGWP